MKKILSLTVVCLLILSLVGCKNSSPSTNVSSNPLTSNDNGSEEPENDLNQDVTSQTSSLENSGSSTPANTNSKPSSNSAKSVSLAVETSRAPSTDVATMVEDGYIYYSISSYHGSTPGVYRKKINGGLQEKILDQSVMDVKVLNGKLYYLSNAQKLYRCDIDGTNVITLDESGGVISFEVAGNWVFVTRTLPNNTIVDVSNIRELYAISTDGSKTKQIKPNVPNHGGARIEIHGFNRGYCYLTVKHCYVPKGTDYLYWESLKLRIDYRSADLTQSVLNNKANFTYNNFLSCSYDEFGDHAIFYDYFCYATPSDRIMISLINNTAVKLSDDRFSTGTRVRDYYVYKKQTSTSSQFELSFIDFQGNIKNVKLDLSEGGKYNICELYSSQDVHNNLIYVTRFNHSTFDMELIAISPEGDIIKIYSLSK